MKKFLFSLLTFSSLYVASQIPQSFNYQAVARNSNGGVISNQFISVEISIRDGSPTANIVYQEIDTATTNQFGLFTVAIGAGQVQVGTNLTAVNWATGNKYLEVGFNSTGGNTFTPMGTTELLSVPYALYAANNLALNYAVYSEIESNGVPSQTSFIDSTWQPRVLNNTESYAGTSISRNGNQITLQPGLYRIAASVQWAISMTPNLNEISSVLANSLLRLADTSNNTYLLSEGQLPNVGIQVTLIDGAWYGYNYSASLEGIISISTATTLSLQQYIGYEAGSAYYDSFFTARGGIPMNVGQNEVYARILIQKVN